MNKYHRDPTWPPMPKAWLKRKYLKELRSCKEIAKIWGKKKGPVKWRGKWIPWPGERWVWVRLARLNIQTRNTSKAFRLSRLGSEKVSDSYLTGTDGNLEHRTKLGLARHQGLVGHHKDQVKKNNHPRNLNKMTRAAHNKIHGRNSPPPEQIPIFEVYMRLAEVVASRSHHDEIKVGAVVVSEDMRRVLALGYNGNASGLPHKCDSTIPGESGMIHAEQNALINAGEHGTDRALFVTVSPCLSCVKLCINAGIKYIYYRVQYRDLHPIKVARYRGIMVCEYSKWKDHQW